MPTNEAALLADQEIRVSELGSLNITPIRADAYDDTALATFADFLAREMRHDYSMAIAHGLQWYRGQIGVELCSLGRAQTLRNLTTLACMDHEAKLLRERFESRSRFQTLPERQQLGVVAHLPRRMRILRMAAALAVVALGGVWIARNFAA